MKRCCYRGCSESNPQPIENFYKNKSTKDGLSSGCKKCSNTAHNKYRALNPHKDREYNKRQYIKRITSNPEYEHNSYMRRRQTKAIAMKKYREKHKIYLSKLRTVYQRTRRANDPTFKIITNLRSRVYHAIKRNYKAGSAVKDLGCTVQQFKNYIEQKFQSGMSWENYGRATWHLDHIIPLDYFDLTNREQFLKACYYTNYQPLWAKDNCSKNNKII